MKRRKSFGVFAKDGTLTNHEKRKMFIYVTMIILGAFFVSSIREYTEPIIEKVGGFWMLIVSGGAIVLLYYVLDMKKY